MACGGNGNAPSYCSACRRGTCRLREVRSFTIVKDHGKSIDTTPPHLYRMRPALDSTTKTCPSRKLRRTYLTSAYTTWSNPTHLLEYPWSKPQVRDDVSPCGIRAANYSGGQGELHGCLKDPAVEPGRVLMGHMNGVSVYGTVKAWEECPNLVYGV